jgi:hypothetical protein
MLCLFPSVSPSDVAIHVEPFGSEFTQAARARSDMPKFQTVNMQDKARMTAFIMAPDAKDWCRGKANSIQMR